MIDATLRPYVRKFFEGVTLGEIMTREVMSVGVEASLTEVERLMSLKDVRHVPVVDDDGKLVGLLTQRDFYRIAPPRIAEDGTRFYLKEHLDSFILRHVMIKEPFALKSGDSLAVALTALAKYRFGCLLIVDDAGKLCGIVTLTDIVRLGAGLLTE